jgi:predicted kinase
MFAFIRGFESKAEAARGTNTVAVVDIGSAGYVVANVLAESNLTTGQTVVADCVNPVAQSRTA